MDKLPLNHQRTTGSSNDRRGSTLLIVMVLLAMLAVVGYMFYTFAASENGNARYFSDSQKVFVAEIDPEAFYDWGLQQLIVGPDASLTQTALAGKRHSLLPSLFGRDIHPYNSAGVRLSSNTAGLPFVDQDQDFVADGVTATTPQGQQLIEFNDSAVMNTAGGYGSARDLTNWPDPGVDYTYPDINNVWLAYKGFAIDANGNTVQVIIPSFHRPQLLRTTGGAPVLDWHTNATMAGRVLRPHPSHTNPNGQTRFPDALSLGGTTLTSAFPFQQGVSSRQGVWSLAGNYVHGTTVVPPYEYDVDNDGDLIKEGVWLDLQYPVQTTSSGQKYVPLISFTVYDADALFNLNVHGNLMALAQSTSVSNVAGLSGFISKSNQGLTTSEVNAAIGLNADPNVGPDFSGTLAELDAATKQHQYQFSGTSFTALQMSNMEWYRAMVGAANFQSASTFNDLYPGRYGEATSVLYAALLYGINNGGNVAGTPLNRMPFPGVSGTDDNWNKYEGMYAWELTSGMPGISSPANYQLQYTPNTPRFYPATFAYYAPYPFGTPLDYRGDGTIAVAGSGAKNRRTTTVNRIKYPVFVNYDNPGAISTLSPAGASDETNLNSVDVAWRPDSTGGAQMLDASGNPLFTAAGQGPLPVTQVDEDLETIADPISASSSDSIFPVSENAGLHLSQTDRTNRLVSSRMRLLSPFNLGASTRADAMAQQYTALSWDRKQFGYAGNGLSRIWEFSDLDGDAQMIRETFPPQFGGVGPYSSTDPFRPPVRKLLEIAVGTTTPGNTTLTTTGNLKPQFRLSLNHLTTTDATGVNIIQRGLTPHDPALTRSPVTSPSQEYLARQDRQQMARDIYVMLYTLGGGLDFAGTQNDLSGGPLPATGYTGDNSTFNLYNDRQLREMAQFAVNVVDALDPDHVMTKFEYDKNLGDGWNLDDNAYTNDSFPAYAINDVKYNPDFFEDSDGRGVVYGVEMQEMTLSELLVFKTHVETSSTDSTLKDNTDTELDESKDRYHTYLELRNVGPKNITFSSQYRIRSVPKDNTGVAGKQRFVTLTGGTINAGALLTMGNAGEVDGGSILNTHSRFRSRNSGYTSGPFTNPGAFIVPPNPNTNLNLDLVEDRNGTGAYRFQLVDPHYTPATVAVDTNVNNDEDITNSTSGSDKPGAFFNASTVVNDATPQNERPMFILERRQYPDRPAPTFKDQPQEDDNPWVPVDYISVDANIGIVQFNPYSTDLGAALDAKLQGLVSRERDQPLVRDTKTSVGTRGMRNHGAGIVANSFMSENSGSPATFDNWQMYYDRPFASPVELFQIPLYGPQYVTKWTNELASGAATTSLSPLEQTSSMKEEYDAYAGNAGEQNAVPFATMAAGKILQPEAIENQAEAPGMKTPALDNRWYRLFEFYEVPTRTHRQLGNPLSILRTPGKLNLNTLRHTSVLAGLLDDVDVMTFAGYQTSRPTLSTTDGGDSDGNMPGGLRDWWVQFLKARDGRRVFTGGTDLDANNNPIARNLPDSVTGLFLPGLADSSPFRSFASAGYHRITGSLESPASALDQTMFRRLPFDLQSQNSSGDPTTDLTFNTRHLWEVGNATEHDNSAVDAVMRHRLLSKIYNNTTNRSHVFNVFMSVQLFEADDSAGAQNVRIGGPLTGSPIYRSFFVIDRSQPEEAYDSATSSFKNFRALVKYRLPLN